MFVKKISLVNFRSHSELALSLNNNVVLIGDNGAGKTNILEAIHMISTTKSFRAKYDRDVIQHDADFAKISIITNEDDKLDLLVSSSTTMENASSKKVQVNGTPKTLKSFAGRLKSVLFSPENIEILMGTPANRRKYIDSIFFQIDDDYKEAYSKYTHIVKQRNKVLENINENNRGHNQIDYWNKELLENGIILQVKRSELFNFFTLGLPHLWDNLNEKGKLSIKYKMNEISPQRLADYFQKEIAAKTTLVGPHRDDFELYMNDNDISQYGSRGQQRTAILALKLAEVEYFDSKTSELPILLLDDIFSELDERHKNAVINNVKSQQTIITSAEKSDYLPSDIEIINI